MDRLLSRALLTTILTCAIGANSQELQSFTSTDGSFSLIIPAEFAIFPGPAQPEKIGLVLLLKSVGSAFPTFNIIEEPSPYSTSALDNSQQAQRVVDSYHSVGIVDAKSVAAGLVSLAGQAAFYTEIEYTNRGQDFTAAVTLVPAGEQHLILTFIDYAGAFAAHKNLLTQIQQSLRFNRNRAALPQTQANHRTAVFWGILLMAGIAVIVMVGRLKRRKGS